MVSLEGRPSLARRQLGRRLRRLREQAGKTIEEVIAAKAASRTKVWRIEGGKTVVKAGDVLVLARLYGVEGAAVDELLALAEATQTSGYVEDYGTAVTEQLGLLADLESAASAIADYNSELVTGLLQTADYARALIRTDRPLSATVVEQRVAFRMKRQRAFFDRPSPGRLNAIMTAGALNIRVGSREVMEAEIAHLRAIGERDGMSVRVLPFDNGVHAAMRGPFTILDFDNPEDPAVVHTESLVGSRYIERADHVTQFRVAFDEMRAQAVPLKEWNDFRFDTLGQGERE